MEKAELLELGVEEVEADLVVMEDLVEDQVAEEVEGMEVMVDVEEIVGIMGAVEEVEVLEEMEVIMVVVEEDTVKRLMEVIMAEVVEDISVVEEMMVAEVEDLIIMGVAEVEAVI